jgi:CRP-like cAMP-binding protein
LSNANEKGNKSLSYVWQRDGRDEPALSRSGGRGVIHQSGESANVIAQQNTLSSLLEGRRRSRNLLLDSLPGAEYARLWPHLESITVKQGDVLNAPEVRLRHVYFPTNTVIALLVQMEDGEAVEAGLVGLDGIVNLSVFWGEESSPYTAVALQTGYALRMRADVFRREVKYTDALQISLMRYTSLSFNCAAQRAACNSLHSIKQRVTSWLLGLSDLLGRDKFCATHELISGLLGIRRAGVTEAVNELKHSGALRSSRGEFEIIEPQRLEQSACECYRILKAEVESIRDARTTGLQPQRSTGTNTRG